jgi:hypothetical protein
MTDEALASNLYVISGASAVVRRNNISRFRFVDCGVHAHQRTWLPKKDGIRASRSELRMMFADAVDNRVTELTFVSLQSTNSAFIAEIPALFGPMSRVGSLTMLDNVGHMLSTPPQVVALVDAVLAAPTNLLESLRIRTTGSYTDKTTANALVRLIDAGVLRTLRCGEEHDAAAAVIGAAMKSASMEKLILHFECTRANALQKILDRNPRPVDSSVLRIQAEGRHFVVQDGLVLTSQAESDDDNQ